MTARATILARLAAAGTRLARTDTLVVDLAADPPLSQCLRDLAATEAPRIVAGAAAIMLALDASRGMIAVREADALHAIETALTLAGAVRLRAVQVPPLWPSTGLDRDVGGPHALLLDGNQLLELEAIALARTPVARRITLLGAVQRPAVYTLTRALSIESLLELAGGARVAAPVVLDGGAYGALADQEAAPRTSLLLVLPSDHPLVARARTSTNDWLRRAASVCEGCRACTDACPTALDGRALAPHDIVATLVSGRDDGTKLAHAAACTQCGVCDLVCPAAISPLALVNAVRTRLPAPSTIAQPRAAFHPDRALRRTSIELWLSRLGLPSDWASAALPSLRV